MDFRCGFTRGLEEGRVWHPCCMLGFSLVCLTGFISSMWANCFFVSVCVCVYTCVSVVYVYVHVCVCLCVCMSRLEVNIGCLL